LKIYGSRNISWCLARMENRQIFFIFSYNLKSYEKKRDNEGELMRKSTVWEYKAIGMRLKSSTIAYLYYLQFGQAICKMALTGLQVFG
jgi:hypothetical protein